MEILNANEFLRKNSHETNENNLIEFAKQHVIAALIEAYQNAKIENNYIDKNSILNSYLLTNVM